MWVRVRMRVRVRVWVRARARVRVGVGVGVRVSTRTERPMRRPMTSCCSAIARSLSAKPRRHAITTPAQKLAGAASG